MTKQGFSKTDTHPNTLIVGVDAPYNKTKNIDSYFDEFLNLVKTCEIPFTSKCFIKLREIDNAYFLTKGKREEISELCKKEEIAHVVFSEPLTTVQYRNLTDFLDCTIFDRTELILEIFQNSAHSAEGKTQVAIARLKHLKSRLVGKALHFSQQSGTIGLRSGFGETAKEKETRHIEELILKLKKELERIEKTRATQRKKRHSNQVPQFCLIGYTNSGKSTILNTLTKSNVLAEDKLFATLDTTTRELYVEGKKKGVLLDTVGFIQQLPHHLIDAFKSTLSELNFADLLIHVIDISDQNWEEHIAVVYAILHDLKINKKILYVFNKEDKITNFPNLASLLAQYQPHLIISALSKTGITPLTEFLSNWPSSTP